MSYHLTYPRPSTGSGGPAPGERRPLLAPERRLRTTGRADDERTATDFLCDGCDRRRPRGQARAAGPARQAGPLRPAVRARRLRRRLRRQHQGAQVAPHPRAGDPGPEEPRPPRRLRLRGQHRRRRRRAAADAARVQRGGVPQGAHPAARGRASTAAASSSCRATRPCAARSSRSSSRSCSPKARPCSAGARCRPTTACSARPPAPASRSCGRCSSAAAPTSPTTWRSSASST